jgi:hypothetical protein
MKTLLPLLIVSFLILPSCNKKRTSKVGTLDPLLSVIAKKDLPEKELISAIKHLGPVTEPASFWNGIASNATYSPNHRRHAVFQLFKRHITSDLTLSEFGKRLEGATWLEDKNIDQMGFLSGQWEMEYTGDDSIFRLYILSHPPSNWIIIIKISPEMTRAQLIKVIRGEAVGQGIKNGKVRQIQFSPSLDRLYGLQKS